jgi:hypothetical protein
VTATVTKVQSVSGYREVTRNRATAMKAPDTIRFLVLQTYDGPRADPDWPAATWWRLTACASGWRH